jgi:hypothetical protein
MSLPVSVRTEDGVKTAFKEETQTLVVNAHGALIELANHVEVGQTLYLTNRAIKREEGCRVTYLGAASRGRAQIGVEFIRPSPDFWCIAFPPEDWTIPDHTPETRKTDAKSEAPRVAAEKSSGR